MTSRIYTINGLVKMLPLLSLLSSTVNELCVSEDLDVILAMHYIQITLTWWFMAAESLLVMINNKLIYIVLISTLLVYTIEGASGKRGSLVLRKCPLNFGKYFYLYFINGKCWELHTAEL